MELPVNKRIETLLTHFKITQKQLAEKANLSENTISNAKKGKNVPAVDFFNSIYKAYPKINPKWLYMGIGKMMVDDNGQESADPDATNTVEVHDECQKMIITLQTEIQYLKTQINDKEEIIKLLKKDQTNI